MFLEGETLGILKLSYQLQSLILFTRMGAYPHFFLSSTNNMFSLILDREEGREKERETSM